MKVYELFTELSSEKRLDILKTLCKEPMTFTTLIKEVDINSTEASRQLSRLIQVRFIEKKGDGRYYNTLFANLVISSISGMNYISENSGYFLEHDTSPIPFELLGQIDALSTGEMVTGVYNILNKHEKLSEDISGYFWNMSDDFPRHHMPNVEKVLEQGMEIRVIFPKKLILSLKLSEKTREKIQFRAQDEIKLSVMTTNSFSMLKLPGQDGKIDQNTAIFGYDERFRKWCEKLFLYYWDAKGILS